MDCLDELEKLKPKETAIWEENVGAWEEYAQAMHSNPTKYLEFGKLAWCYRHSKYCPVYQSVADVVETVPSSVKDVIAFKESLNDKLQQALSEVEQLQQNIASSKDCIGSAVGNKFPSALNVK